MSIYFSFRIWKMTFSFTCNLSKNDWFTNTNLTNLPNLFVLFE